MADSKLVVRLSLDSGIPLAEREALLAALSQEATVQESRSKRDIQTIAETTVQIVKDLGAVAGAISGVITLSKTIIDWRKKARERGVQPKGRLSHPQTNPLDLGKASDSEIADWFRDLPV